MTADDLLALARIYAAATDVTLTTVGRRACGNDKIFTRLADGRGCNVLSLERAGKWFAANWPTGISWPQGISVPRGAAA